MQTNKYINKQIFFKMEVSNLVGEDQCSSNFNVHATLVKMQILIQEVWVGASESPFFFWQASGWFRYCLSPFIIWIARTEANWEVNGFFWFVFQMSDFMSMVRFGRGIDQRAKKISERLWGLFWELATSPLLWLQPGSGDERMVGTDQVYQLVSARTGGQKSWWYRCWWKK